MKNNKTLILTTAIISVFLIAITLGSGLFTGLLGGVDEAYNSLTADTQQTENSSEIVFDYPYITENDLNKHQDKPYYGFYKNTILFMDSVEKAEYNNELLSYQQAANIGGETVKYFYGQTLGQITPALVMLKNNMDEKIYTYALGFGESDNMYSNNVTININAITGKITFLNCREPIGISPVEGIADKYGKEISQSVKSNIENKVKNDLQLLGYNEDFEILNYGFNTKAFEGYLNYKVVVRIAEDDLKTFTYLTTDNTYFDIIMFCDYV